MFRFVAIIASLFTASAFIAAPRAMRSASLKMSYENEIGALPPVGFWDPLGLSAGIDEDTFKKYRTAELKHGRVAMLAVTGYIIAANARFPGTIDLDGTSFQSIPNGVAALAAVPPFGWFQIGASAGYWELFGWQQASEEVGDFGFLDKATAQKFDAKPEVKAELKTKELQNGRLAMLAITELLTHDLAKPAGESLFTIHHF